MNLWKVYCHYDSGDHEKGYYESQLFARREDAEKFYTDLAGRWDGEYNKTSVVEVAVSPGPVEVGDPESWLHVVYT